jgi:hypothetical protein
MTQFIELILPMKGAHPGHNQFEKNEAQGCRDRDFVRQKKKKRLFFPMEECKRAADNLAKALEQYQLDLQSFKEQTDAWERKKSKRDADVWAIRKKWADARADTAPYEVVLGCGDDCGNGYSEVRKTYCWRTANYERRCRPTPDKFKAWEDAEVNDYLSTNPLRDPPLPPPVPPVQYLVCQDCRQYMNISGNDFSASANRQIHQCLIDLQSKGEPAKASESAKFDKAESADQADRKKAEEAGKGTTKTDAQKSSVQPWYRRTAGRILIGLICATVMLMVAWAIYQLWDRNKPHLMSSPDPSVFLVGSP